jgi:hypothetical protein
MFAPLLLFGPFAGVLIDRTDRRTAIAVAHLLRGHQSHGNMRRVSLAERVAEIVQPQIREVVLRYLRTLARRCGPSPPRAAPRPCGCSPAGSPPPTPKSPRWRSCTADTGRSS